jgi:hypothetical protein
VRQTYFAMMGIFGLAVACGGDPKQLIPPVDEFGEGVVMGRVASTLSGVPGSWTGASVRALHIYEDGVAESAVEKPVEVANDGNYVLNVPLPDGQMDAIVIEAQRDGQVVGSVLLAGPLGVGETRVAAPITPETTAEVGIFSSIRASGDWQAGSSIATLRMLVTDRLARALAAAGDPLAVDMAASGIAAGMSAWRSALLHPTVGESPTRLNMALEGMIAAQQAIDADLHESSSSVEREAAEAETLSLFIQAHRSAGILLRSLTRPAHAMAEALDVYGPAMPTGVRAEATVSVNSLRAEVLTRAVDGELLTAGFDDATVLSAREASDRLISDLETAELEPATAVSKIREAWTRYNIVVEDLIDDVVDLDNEAYVDVRVSIVSSRETLEEVIDELQSSVTPGVTADVTADAIGNFFWDVGGELNRDRLVSLGYTNEQSLAILETLADVAASSD